LSQLAKISRSENENPRSLKLLPEQFWDKNARFRCVVEKGVTKVGRREKNRSPRNLQKKSHWSGEKGRTHKLTLEEGQEGISYIQKVKEGTGQPIFLIIGKAGGRPHGRVRTTFISTTKGDTGGSEDLGY